MGLPPEDPLLVGLLPEDLLLVDLPPEDLLLLDLPPEDLAHAEPGVLIHVVLLNKKRQLS